MSNYACLTNCIQPETNNLGIITIVIECIKTCFLFLKKSLILSDFNASSADDWTKSFYRWSSLSLLQQVIRCCWWCLNLFWFGLFRIWLKFEKYLTRWDGIRSSVYYAAVCHFLGNAVLPSKLHKKGRGKTTKNSFWRLIKKLESFK